MKNLTYTILEDSPGYFRAEVTAENGHILTIYSKKDECFTPRYMNGNTRDLIGLSLYLKENELAAPGDVIYFEESKVKWEIK